jgi:hypothetical protein
MNDRVRAFLDELRQLLAALVAVVAAVGNGRVIGHHVVDPRQFLVEPGERLGGFLRIPVEKRDRASQLRILELRRVDIRFSAFADSRRSRRTRLLDAGRSIRRRTGVKEKHRERGERAAEERRDVRHGKR